MFQEPDAFPLLWKSKFELKFEFSFSSVKNIMDLGVDTDDGCLVHFIDNDTKNIYTFDIYNEYWLEENEMKDEVWIDVSAALEKIEKQKKLKEFDRKTAEVRNQPIKCRDNTEYTSWRSY